MITLLLILFVFGIIFIGMPIALVQKGIEAHNDKKITRVEVLDTSGKKVSFKVVYTDGVKFETVKIGSERYNFLRAKC